MTTTKVIMLEWYCESCEHVEPANTGLGPEDSYAIGSEEDCVYCDGGIAIVRRRRRI
jgi:hypothetical protein